MREGPSRRATVLVKALAGLVASTVAAESAGHSAGRRPALAVQRLTYQSFGETDRALRSSPAGRPFDAFAQCAISRVCTSSKHRAPDCPFAGQSLRRRFLKTPSQPTASQCRGLQNLQNFPVTTASAPHWLAGPRSQSVTPDVSIAFGRSSLPGQREIGWASRVATDVRRARWSRRLRSVQPGGVLKRDGE